MPRKSWAEAQPTPPPAQPTRTVIAVGERASTRRPHNPTNPLARVRDSRERALPFRGWTGDGRGPSFVGSRLSDLRHGETEGKPGTAKQSARALLPEPVPRLLVLRLGVGFGL